MPETIPLSTNLSVKRQDIIVYHTVGRASPTNFVLEGVSAKDGIEGSVERPVERDTNA